MFRSVWGLQGPEIRTPGVLPDLFICSLRSMKWPAQCQSGHSGKACWDSPSLNRALTLSHEEFWFSIFCLNICNLFLLLCVLSEFLKSSFSPDVCNPCFRSALEQGAGKSVLMLGLSSRNRLGVLILQVNFLTYFIFASIRWDNKACDRYIVYCEKIRGMWKMVRWCQGVEMGTHVG